MDTNQIRVRFAPSPTGNLHIGNARTAIFNWLFAKKNKGSFILRIEDTDKQRSDEKYITSIINDLRWLGLNWDEGVDTGGEFGPYKQSLRTEIYKENLDLLKKEGKIYPCFCTPEELEAKRLEAKANKQIPVYNNKCRNLTQEQIDAFKTEGKQYVYRLKTNPGAVVIEDIIRGNVSIETDTFGDFILTKSDGLPAFNFAVAVDDGLMKISHIIRGEDHLTNTPKHILIMQALGFNIPKFAHLPLINGADGTPLSKRHGHTSVSQYRDLGYLPEGLTNYLSLLGWSPEDETEIMNLSNIADRFSLKRVNKAAATFDLTKLNWVNTCHLKNTDISRIADISIPYLKQANMLKGAITEDTNTWLLKVVKTLLPYINCISELPKYAAVLFDTETIFDEAAKDVLSQESIPTLLNSLKSKMQEIKTQYITLDEFKTILKDVQTETGIKGKMLFQPIRASFTGSLSGPELVDIVPLIPLNILTNRINEALNIKIKNN